MNRIPYHSLKEPKTHQKQIFFKLRNLRVVLANVTIRLCKDNFKVVAGTVPTCGLYPLVVSQSLEAECGLRRLIAKLPNILAISFYSKKSYISFFLIRSYTFRNVPEDQPVHGALPEPHGGAAL